jgi:hypothetical protein
MYSKINESLYMIVESKSISNRLLSVFMVILSLLIIQNACCVFGRKKMQKREKYVKPDFG